jgi:hypothetical protein
VGERKWDLLRNKVYKFSHLAIYSGDDEEELSVERAGTATDPTIAGAPGVDGTLSKHSGA